MNRAPGILVYADSVRSPELRHEVPLAIGDPFLYLESDGRRAVAISQMELVRLRELDTGLELIPYEELGIDELLGQGQSREMVGLELSLRACRRLGIDEAIVPPGFPLELGDFLRGNGVSLHVDREVFADRRRIKTASQLAGIRRAQRAAEAGMHAARELLRQAESHDGALVLEGEPLTCEAIKVAVENALGAHGASTDELIVSHGAQTAVGHDSGSGAIAWGEPVLLDIFPRDRESGCFADMTRTFVVGDAPAVLIEQHALCAEALQLALAEIRPGAVGADLHRLVSDLFAAHGYPTQLHKEPGVTLEDGFYHALGHGVGLDIHEPPYLGRSGTALVAGDVVAVEPGLYRYGVGGCRIEDLVLVTAGGCENLTTFSYDLRP